MMTKLLENLRKHRLWPVIAALTVIILAGILIEGLSLLQYRYTHNMLEQELDYRAESELTLKSVRVRSMLKANERMIRNYEWAITRSHQNNDALYSILHRLVKTNNDVSCGFVAFVPNYFPGRGELYEPVAFNRDDSIITMQIAGASHDYTQREFYRKAVEEGVSCWTDPYLDADATDKMVTTYAVPLTNEAGDTIGTFGIDMSTQGIIDTLNVKHGLESTFYLLLTEDGELIAQPDSSHTKWHDVDDVIRMINDSTVERKPSSSGKSKIITFHDSKDNSLGYIYHAFMKGQPHWQVVMVCYDNEVYSKLKTLRRNLLLMMLAGFSLLGFILYRFNRNVQRLHKSKLNKERTDSELRIAQNIQAEMLPGQEIHRPDVDICGKQVTALEVGGDLYDYLVRDEKLYFCIGDVSGKGVPSSLVMAVVHSHFYSLAKHESNPARIMQAINEIACPGNETNMFVTLFVGVLDLPTGRLRYCNAGHDAPLIITDEVKSLEVNPNLPIGLYDNFKYILQETQLPQECTMLLYTDGLTETFNAEHKQYGLQRVIDTAQACQQQGKTAPTALMGAMHESAIRFADGTEQSDDLTMLALHYHRPVEKTVLDKSITLSNDVQQVPELNQFVKSVAEELNLETSLSSQLMLAVEEAVVNAMNYAYPIGTQGDITVEAQATEQDLKFVITDAGKAFDPTRESEADTTLSVEDRPIGGLGILLVQSLMDSINYERVDGKNVLTLKKAISN